MLVIDVKRLRRAALSITAITVGCVRSRLSGRNVSVTPMEHMKEGGKTPLSFYLNTSISCLSVCDRSQTLLLFYVRAGLYKKYYMTLCLIF